MFHVKQLEMLCVLVRRWNDTVRLVSRRDCALLETRHVANCLTLVPLVEQLRPKAILDIGSGGGFPGLVLAIATEIPVHLVEADLRKAEFLREASRRLGLTTTIHAMRAEMVDMKADLVTARAVAPFANLWPVACRLLSEGGTGLFLKGDAVTAELRHSDPGLAWSWPAGVVVEMRVAG